MIIFDLIQNFIANMLAKETGHYFARIDILCLSVVLFLWNGEYQMWDSVGSVGSVGVCGFLGFL